MKKLAYVLGALGILFAIIVSIPFFIDWSAYKPQLVEAAEQASGRDIEVAGDLKFSLLPSPRLSAEQVSISGLGAAPEPLLRAERIAAAVELWPLLRKQVDVKYIALDAPQLHLVAYADGSNNWAEAEQAADDPQPAADVSSGGLAVNDFRITDGQLVYINQSDSSEMNITELQAEIEVLGLAGPFRVDSSLTLDGLPLTVDGEAGENGAVDLTLGIADAASVKFAGRIEAGALPEDPTAISGRIELTASSLADVMAALPDDASDEEAAKPSPAMTKRLNLTAQVSGTSVRLMLMDLAGSLGDLSAGGEITVDLTDRTTVDGRLDLGVIALEDWMSDEPEKTSSDPLEVSIPDSIDADLDLRIAGLTYGNARIGNIASAASLRDGVARLETTRLALPAGAQMLISATVRAPNDRLQGEGDVQLRAPDLRQLLAAFGSAPAVSRLGALDMRGKVAILDQSVGLTNLRGKLDETSFSGSLLYGLVGNGTARIDLTADRLDLDRYPAQQAAADAQGPQDDDAPLPDVLFNVSLGEVVSGGTSYQNVAAKGTMTAGQLVLERASMSAPGGYQLVAAGKVDDVGGNALNTDLTVSLDGPDARGGVGVKGPLDKLALDGTLRYAGADITVLGSASAGDAPAYDVSVRAKAPEASAVLAALSTTPGPARPPIGALDLAFGIKGDARSAKVEGISGKIGPVALSGAADINLAGAVPVINARLAAPDVPLRALIGPEAASAEIAAATGQDRWSKDPLPLDMLEAFDGQLTFQTEKLTLDDYVLKGADLVIVSTGRQVELKQFRAGLWDGTLQFGASLDARSGAPTLNLNYAIANVSLEQLTNAMAAMKPATGTISLAGKYAARGDSEFALVSSLTGSGNMAARDGIIRRIDLQKVNKNMSSLRTVNEFITFSLAALSGGQTSYTSLSADLVAKNGIMSVQNAKSDMEGGNVTASGTINLPQWTTDLQGKFALKDHADAPSIGVSIRGSASAPEVKYDLAAMQRYFGVRFAVAGLNAIVNKEGFDPGALLGLGKKDGSTAASASDATAGTDSSQTGDAAPATPAEKPSAEKELQGLLIKGLGGLLRKGKMEEEASPAPE